MDRLRDIGDDGPAPRFLIGWRKWVFYCRVAAHVKLHFLLRVLCGTMPLGIYPRFLIRALQFLWAVRHNKVVLLGRLYKLQLYIPAYPSKAFFHALEKLYRPDPGPVSVVFSMTRACSYHCPHCYQGRDSGSDLDLPLLIETAHRMQDVGVSFFNVEGGEPLQRFDRLVELIESIDDRAEVWINTTGAGLTAEKVERLVGAGLGGVMVSIHTPHAAEHDAFTGAQGSFETACDALRSFRRRGLFTAINCCPNAQAIAVGDLEGIFEVGRSLGCSLIQVIHLKTAGGWLGQDEKVEGLAELVGTVERLHLDYNTQGGYRGFPSIAAQVFDEHRALFGCTAGGVDRFYLGADGEVQPCEFLGISFGNVKEEDFLTIFRRMRETFREPGTDWLCCTQAAFIDRLIEERGLTRTPVPWEITREFIGEWKRGDPTPLYRRLGIYKTP